MAAVRNHGRTLIAGLVVLGVLGFVGITAANRFELDLLTRAASFFAGGFLAAHLVRRLLIDLDTTTFGALAAVGWDWIIAAVGAVVGAIELPQARQVR